MSSSAKLSKLRALGGTTICTCRSDSSRVTKLSSLDFNLARQFTSRCKGEQQRASGTVRIKALRNHCLERWQQESQSLTRSGLGNSNQIPSFGDDWPRVGLDRRRAGEASVGQRRHNTWRELAHFEGLPRRDAGSSDGHFRMVDTSNVPHWTSRFVVNLATEGFPAISTTTGWCRSAIASVTVHRSGTTVVEIVLGSTISTTVHALATAATESCTLRRTLHGDRRRRNIHRRFHNTRRRCPRSFARCAVEVIVSTIVGVEDAPHVGCNFLGL
mmetsp:Transcript_9793/g.17299  ORF Transcript_9793/g.17299 Transcript_9793/m.17299 type:complete len:272 (+) Transcript_9793:1454-2269(+)